MESPVRTTFAPLTLALASALMLLPACGRYGEPRPPEVFSPRGVEDLRASADLEGVHFEWKAPGRDRRGRELKSLNGYQVMRKQIERPADIVDPRVKFERLAEIPDTHIEAQEELRKKARAEGKISRRVKVDPELTEFRYTDTAPKSGQTYLYRIIPINQGSVEGLVPKLVKVIYRGDASVVSIVDAADIDEQAAQQKEDEERDKAERSYF